MGHPSEHECAGSPFAQNMGSPCLPSNQGVAQGRQGADVALPAHLLTMPSQAQWPSAAGSNGLDAAAAVENCCNGMQVIPQQIQTTALWHAPVHADKRCGQPWAAGLSQCVHSHVLCGKSCANRWGMRQGTGPGMSIVQGLWNWDGLKGNTGTAATSCDPKTDPPPRIEAHPAPFYPAVSRQATPPD